MRLVVLGMIGRCPFGGQTWLSLNWLRGLSGLGHEAWYVEDDTCWPFDPIKLTVTNDCSYAIAHIRSSLERIGLADHWAYRFGGDGGPCWGLSAAALRDLYRTCDALLNFGTCDLRDQHLAAPVRVYIESDPVTSQLRLANGDEHTRVAFKTHDGLFSYGENYGAPDCRVPLCGLTFRPIRQPIDLDQWRVCFDAAAPHFTTIGNYRQPGNDVEYDHTVYTWSKHHEWEKFIDLPTRTRQTFEVALGVSEQADRDRLRTHGWTVVPPYEMSLDVFGAYPDYIRKSRAEIAVAKDQNVRLRSGWFSERDACYLASGKPVVAQDTGFGNILPVGEGLFAFATIDEALAAIDAINSDYRRHCRAAREIAEEYFDAPRIARWLLERIGGC